MKKLETLGFFEAGASGKVLPLGKMSHYMMRNGIKCAVVEQAVYLYESKFYMIESVRRVLGYRQEHFYYELEPAEVGKVHLYSDCDCGRTLYETFIMDKPEPFTACGCRDDETGQTTLLFDNARWSELEFCSDGFCNWYRWYEDGMMFHKEVSKDDFIERMKLLKQNNFAEI